MDLQITAEQDGSTNGLLLFKIRNKVVAEYTLRDSAQPIGVVEDQLMATLHTELQTNLINIERIESELRDLTK